MGDIEIDLLTIEDICGGKLEVLKECKTTSAITDLAILTGGVYNTQSKKNWLSGSKDEDIDENFDTLKERHGVYTLKSTSPKSALVNYVYGDYRGVILLPKFLNCSTIRPVLRIPDEVYNYLSFKIKSGNEVDFGEYPQWAVSPTLNETLEELYRNNKLACTENAYTLKFSIISGCESSTSYPEYEYQNKRYVRVSAHAYSYQSNSKARLSNGEYITKEDKNIWLEVSPVTWLVDEKTQILISKNCLLGGIPFARYDMVDIPYEQSQIYNFIDNYMLKEIIKNRKLYLDVTKEMDTVINKFERDMNVSDISEEELALLKEALTKEKKRNNR